MGMRYPQYAFFVYGWYEPEWWDPTTSTSFNCSLSREEMIGVVQYVLGSFVIEFYEDSSSDELLDTGLMVKFNACIML